MPDNTFHLVGEALNAADRAIKTLEELSDALASARTSRRQTSVVATDVIERELDAHVAVAARDLLGRDHVITANAVGSWAGTTGMTIRVRCGGSWELRFLGEGRGGDLFPVTS